MDKELEEIMRKISRGQKDDDVLYLAFKCSYFFWQTVDYVFITDRTQIFKSLYMSCGEKQSLLRKSLECYVSEKTLYRRRREFIHAFKFIVGLLRTYNI